MRCCLRLGLVGLGLVALSFFTGCAKPPAEEAQTNEAALDGEPDVDSIPWEGTDGYGITRKDTQNPNGQAVLVAYAGFGIGLGEAQTWATTLYRDRLRGHGVRQLFAVQGPQDPGYSAFEIGNSHIVPTLLDLSANGAPYIIVVGHSSGSFVAHELLQQLANGDPYGVTDHRVIYFNLDGGGDGLTDQSVGRLRHAYFVGAGMGATGTPSPNQGAMGWLAGAYGWNGSYLEHDANASGCAVGANWCVHISLVNSVPHDPWSGGPIDYSDFFFRPVTTDYLDVAAGEGQF